MLDLSTPIPSAVIVGAIIGIALLTAVGVYLVKLKEKKR
jgi:putative Ca2+/H+ antiporter (TMEM165/GDT1 family)